MSSARSRIIKSEFGDFFKANAKTLISALVIFALGIILGVALAYREVGGEFEVVPRADADTGAGKVFFLSLLVLAASYALILLSSLNKRTALLCCLPYFALGFLLGRFSCALLCRYEVFGVLNFIFVYLPAFLCTVALLLFATATGQFGCCSQACGKGKLKPSFVSLLKIFAVNAALIFAFFIIVGLVVGGVIVPSLF